MAGPPLPVKKGKNGVRFIQKRTPLILSMIYFFLPPWVAFMRFS